jgi:hypothetical protein
MSSSTASIPTPTRHRFEKLVEDNKPSKMYVLHYLLFFHISYDVPITSWESLREITLVEKKFNLSLIEAFTAIALQPDGSACAKALE